MKDRGLSRGQERRASQDEPVPERKPPVRQSFPDRRAPGQIGEGEVREDRIGDSIDPLLGGHALPGFLRVIQIRGPIQPPEQDRLARKKKRPERQRQHSPPPDRPDKPPRQPKGRRYGARVREPEGGNLKESSQF